jgi:EAL domain-containing protein (putative c-di-GMP-specific phosphodiesterase class I)
MATLGWSTTPAVIALATESPFNAELVRSTARIAQVLGIPVCAEFVEDASLREALRDLGVDYAQGYGIAVPEPLGIYIERELVSLA